MLVPWVSLVFNFLKISKLSTSSGFNWVNYHRLYDLRNQRPDNSEFRKQNVLGAGAPWASSLWCHHLPPQRVTTLLALESTGYICLCVTSFMPPATCPLHACLPLRRVPSSPPRPRTPLQAFTWSSKWPAAASFCDFPGAGTRDLSVSKPCPP